MGSLVSIQLFASFFSHQKGNLKCQFEDTELLFELWCNIQMIYSQKLIC